MIVRILQIILVAASGAGLCIVAGCGKQGLPIIPVHGQVTFAGGPPPKAGSITFTPLDIEEGLPRRPGRAQFDEQGNFRVTSFRDGDGLLPGRYQANISCWKGMPSDRDLQSFERLNYVPSDYRPPELHVERGQRKVEVHYDVPPKKQT